MVTRKTKIVGSVSLLFLLVSCGVLIGMWQYIDTKGVELQQQSKEIADYKARQQSYNELEELVESTKDDRDELVAYVLTEDKTIDFLSTIEQVSVEQGIELTTNSLKVVEKDGLFDELLISFSITGEKSRVHAMIEMFEVLPYHTSISTVSLRNTQKGAVLTTEGTIELTVSLLDYDR